MPSKDGTMDDNKKSTKDVVNKKQKQMLNQEEAEKIDVLQTIKDRFRDKGLSGFIKKPEKKERKTIGDVLNREEIDPAKIAEAFGGYVVESLNPSKDELERRLMNRILGGDTRTAAEIDKDIRADRRKEKVDRATVQKVFKGVKSKAEKRVTAPKKGERAAARKTFSAFMGKQKGDKPVTKKPIRDPKTGEVIANPMQPTSKEVARKTKEIKTSARKAFPDAKTPPSDIGQFRRQATRQTKLPLRQTKKGIEVGVKQGRPATREKPKVSFKDLKKQIDAKNPTYVSPKSGGKLPLKRKSRGFKNPATADAAKDAAIGKATRRVGRKARVKAGLTGAGRFAAKRIPGVGMAVAAGEAGARFASGDPKGAAIAGLEGMTSMIPGVGTAISTALGGYGLARDVKNAPKTFKVADKVKQLASKKTAKQITSRKFAKDAYKEVKLTKFNPLKVLNEPIDPKVAGKRGRMMGAKTKLGVAVRAGGIGMGLDMARRAMFKAPKPKLDTGIVGKRSAGG